MISFERWIVLDRNTTVNEGGSKDLLAPNPKHIQHIPLTDKERLNWGKQKEYSLQFFLVGTY